MARLEPARLFGMRQLVAVGADLDLGTLRAGLHIGFVRDQLSLLRERFDLLDGVVPTEKAVLVAAS